MFEIKLKGIIHLINTNKAMMTTQISVRDILQVYEIDDSVNRDINYARKKPISKYIDSFDSEIGIFLPSLVFSFYVDPTKYYNRENKELRIPTGLKLKVLDGQHRIKGLEYLLRSMNDKERKEKILDSTMTAQIYFGLSKNDERNLFADINSNARRVSMSLITKYDTRDITKVLIRDLYNSCTALQIAGVEFNKSRIVRPASTLFCTSARLKVFISCLLFGKINISKKNEQLIKDKYDEILVFLDKFFTVLFDVLPSNPGDVTKYMLGHEALQNAIALYLHEVIILESEKDLKWLYNWEIEVERLQFINWSPKNSLWQPYTVIARFNTKYEHKTFIDNKPYDLLNLLKNELLL